MKKIMVILSIVLLGIIFSSLTGCYPYNEFSPRVREIIIYFPPPGPQPCLECDPRPTPAPDPPVYNPPEKEQPVKYRKDNTDRTEERKSGESSRIRDLDGGRNQKSGRR